MKKLFTFLFALTCAATLFAYDCKIGGIYYNLNSANLTAEVTYQECNFFPSNTYSGTIILPSTIFYNSQTYSVTAIGENAFYWCTDLISITIPNSITTIGKNAFYDCSGLTSVTIPYSVTTIGGDAFGRCYNLKKSNYTGTIAQWCKISLEYGSNPISYSHNFFINDVEVKDLVIPDEVDSIGQYAFEGHTNLTSIAIPNSVTTIGEHAFYLCIGLTSITIPNSVTTIGDFAFFLCSGLNSPLYNANCFVYVPQSYSGTYTIPSGIKQIVGGAFFSCSDLISINIPNSVTMIGDMAFSGCSGLTSIIIPNTVTKIKQRAFENCSNLTSIVIPNSVTTIEYSTFSNCRSLTSVTIGNSVTTIGNSAFYGCSGLTSVTIPNSVTEIGYGAFSGCHGLTSVIIPNSVATIGSGAFGSCSGLTSITIPYSVTTIGDRAFYNCEDLTSITCYAVTPPECGGPVFSGISQDAKVYVPASALADYQSANYWKNMQLYPIAAEVTPMDDENPIVTPSDQDVTITWPITDGTDTYTLTITKNGEVVCVLTFNANGQLTNIAFAAPGHKGARQAPEATLTAQGYQFTVTGLNPGTAYNYSVTATDAGGKTLAEHKGNFSTTGGTGFESVHGLQPTMHKVLRDGQLLIETHNATYTPMGQKVK